MPMIVETDHEGTYCSLDGLQNVEDEYEISKGISRLGGFPPDAYFRMSKHHKKLVTLSDCLDNLEQQLVVSKRLKEFVEARRPPKIEFLKVTIYNHKGKAVPQEYHILSPLQVVDCIDTKASTLHWNKIDPELISGVLKLIIKPETVDPGLLLFRPRHLEHKVLLQRGFADELQAASFTGLRFVEPPEYLGT